MADVDDGDLGLETIRHVAMEFSSPFFRLFALCVVLCCVAEVVRLADDVELAYLSELITDVALNPPHIVTPCPLHPRLNSWRRRMQGRRIDPN
jgi:hypothetical protein